MPASRLAWHNPQLGLFNPTGKVTEDEDDTQRVEKGRIGENQDWGQTEREMWTTHPVRQPISKPRNDYDLVWDCWWQRPSLQGFETVGPEVDVGWNRADITRH